MTNFSPRHLLWGGIRWWLWIGSAKNFKKKKDLQKDSWVPLSCYIMIHLPFSAHGLLFLSGAWINGSVFSCSSMYSLIAAMLLESGHRSIVAWNFMFSICFLSISLSICARMERSRFEAKWEPERPLYTRAKNRSTKRKREGRRERGHALLMSVARDLSFNQSAESAAVAA